FTAGLFLPGNYGAVDNVAKKASIWTPTRSRSSVENAYGHWVKHKAEFPEYENAKQYVESAHDFLKKDSPGLMSKQRPNGDVLIYDKKTNTFGIKDAKGRPRTMFRPKDGIDYWNRQ
ncbi:hypothetical protein Y5S_03776, partial [Alcanivorax nanhaiticus]